MISVSHQINEVDEDEVDVGALGASEDIETYVVLPYHHQKCESSVHHFFLARLIGLNSPSPIPSHSLQFLLSCAPAIAAGSIVTALVGVYNRGESPFLFKGIDGAVYHPSDANQIYQNVGTDSPAAGAMPCGGQRGLL